MKKAFLLIPFIFFLHIAFSQTYTFTGNGNWTVPANWTNYTIPPSILPSGDTIYVNPAAGDSCVLNTAQTISAGASLVVAPGANFILRGGITNSSDSTFTDPRDGQVYTFRYIGNQVWMTQNLNYYVYGSYWYNNNPANGARYGRLYDWLTAYIGVAPPGWRLPSRAEWDTLAAYLGGNSVAGGKMKTTDSWASPNTAATNSSGFNGLPGGSCTTTGYIVFSEMDSVGYWWNSDFVDISTTKAYSLDYNYARASRGTSGRSVGYSVRCIRDSIVTSPPPVLATVETKNVFPVTTNTAVTGGTVPQNGGSPVTVSGVVWDTLPNPTVTASFKTEHAPVIPIRFTDTLTGLQPMKKYYIRAYATNGVGTAYGEEFHFWTVWNQDSTFTDPRDGQVYTFRRIGEQVWMTQNLNYNTAGSLCYENDPANCGTYGRLYNWDTAQIVAPPGWHLPSYAEWYQLANYVADAGALKSTSPLWQLPNVGANNSSGFSALPGGLSINGSFSFKNQYGHWWTTRPDPSYSYLAYFTQLRYDNSSFRADTIFKDNFMSVRCIRD